MRRILFTALIACLTAISFGQFQLTILHTNDMHAHMEATRFDGGMLGGYARQATLIKSIRNSEGELLLLNGGDTFQGTIFFNTYMGLADLAFMNYVGYDAMAVGNHEFDKGPELLAQFIKGANFPLLAANINASGDEHLRGRIRKSYIKLIDGEKVGIVGAITPSVHQISAPGDDVVMLDIVASVQAEVDRLTADGVDKIVLVSHVGYSSEVWLAKQIRNLDVVVGGHSHTFLGSGPGLPEGAPEYPTVVENASGDTALVVQAWHQGMVLGKLDVEFDRAGKVKSWKGGPIPIIEDITEDPVVKAMIDAFNMPVAELKDKVIGSTAIAIPRSGSFSPMANLIADAQLAATQQHGSVAAFINAGGVRAALESGDITYGQAISVQPFSNTLVVLEVTGRELLTALARQGGGTLHPSKGTSYKAVRGPDGWSISDVVIAGEPLDLFKTYKITVNNFTAGGGDDHQELKNAKGQRTDTGLVDIDALIDYIKAYTPLDLPQEKRIKS